MRVEAGKFYRDSIGAKVGPMIFIGSSEFGSEFVEKIGDGRIWTWGGLGRSKATGFDLIAECAEPAKAPGVVLSSPNYEALGAIFRDAFDQASAGKGKDRHAQGERFEDQPILDIGRRRGRGFVLGQAEKKIGEADRMLNRDERGAARRELLGALNYIAAAVILIDEAEAASGRESAA
jgi:hypothetical protein